MKLAAIDIGSNAIRLQIVNVFEEENKVSFKKLEYLRFPLRLGHDVFAKGRITLPTIGRFGKLMKTFKLLCELYEVDATFAVATSAMREADNGKEVAALLLSTTGIDIQIISGDAEAGILNKAIIPYLQPGPMCHVDVGGGSTEINLYDKKKVKASRSFRIGSVRKLSPEERTKTFAEMETWIQKTKFNKNRSIIGIGTGGNINKLFKLSTRTTGGDISLVELRAIRAYVRTFSLKQRMSILKLNPDRADVIIPASEIYIHALQSVGADTMLVPKVGLKDGIIYELYQRTTGRDIYELEYLEEF